MLLKFEIISMKMGQDILLETDIVFFWNILYNVQICGNFIGKWVYWMERRHFWVNSGSILYCLSFSAG